MNGLLSNSPDSVDDVRTDDGETSSVEAAASKADVFLETGLMPKEYILQEIEARGGRLRQQRICRFTGWSAGCISRLLSEMEAEGTIERVRIGNHKIACLPGSKPKLGSSSENDESTR